MNEWINKRKEKIVLLKLKWNSFFLLHQCLKLVRFLFLDYKLVIISLILFNINNIKRIALKLHSFKNDEKNTLLFDIFIF